MAFKVKSAGLYKTIYSTSDLSHIELPHFTVVGRSNVGKSSFLNSLMGRELARVSSKPGKTQSINLYILNNRAIVADLPGYGYAKIPGREKEKWKKLVEGYLKLNMDTKLIFLLVDSRVGITDMDMQMVRWMDYYRIPYTIIATKVDKLKRDEKEKAINGIKLSLGNVKVIPFSSRTGEGKSEILSLMGKLL